MRDTLSSSCHVLPVSRSLMSFSQSITPCAVIASADALTEPSLSILAAGKATCDTCRPKKRKQGASAEKNKRATRDLLQGENERLRQVVMAQNSEITALKIQVSKQSDTIAQLQSGSGAQQQQTPRIGSLQDPTASQNLDVPAASAGYKVDSAAAPVEYKSANGDLNQSFLDTCMAAVQDANIPFELLTGNTADANLMRGQTPWREERLSSEFEQEFEQEQRKQRSLQMQVSSLFSRASACVFYPFHLSAATRPVVLKALTMFLSLTCV